MLLTIYDKAGTKRADVAVNDSSTQSKEVQGDKMCIRDRVCAMLLWWLDAGFVSDVSWDIALLYGFGASLVANGLGGGILGPH